MKVYQNTGIGTIYIWMAPFMPVYVAPFMFAVYDSIYIWMAPANGQANGRPGRGEWPAPANGPSTG